MAADADLDDLPNSLALSPGQVITETTMGRIGRVQNWCHAQGGCGAMVQQGWGDGVFVYSGTNLYPARWWIPTLSTAHDQVVAIVRASAAATGGSPTATLYADGDSASSVAMVVDDPPAYYAIPACDVDTSGDAQLMRFGLETSNATISVDMVRMAYVPLSSPLAVGLAGGITPIDVTALEELEPLSSGVGHTLLDNLEALDARDGRMVLMYSGLQGPTVGGVPTALVSTAPLYMSARPRFNYVRLHRGLARAGRTYQVRARAWGDANRATTLNILTGDPRGWPNARHPFTIPIGAAWHEIEGDVVLEEHDLIASVPHPTTAIGVWPGGPAAAGYSSSTIHSLSIWGP